MFKSITEKVQSYLERIRKASSPNFDTEMRIGVYYLDDKRPEDAIDYFRRAVEAASTNEQHAEAKVLYALTSVRAHISKKIDLGERYADGTPLLTIVENAYRSAVKDCPITEVLFNAALASIGLGEREEYKDYLQRLVESVPNDDVLIRVGRLAVTLRLEDLVRRVKDEFTSRELSVHLYPV